MPAAILEPAEAWPAGRVQTAGGWWIIGACWLLALGFIGLTAANFHAIAAAADRVEALSRLAPGNQLGRGACAAFAATQPPMMFDPDSECWINLTQKKFHDGLWREHEYAFDNAPYGRAQHWSSSFSWWLLLLGAVNHEITGAPMDRAIAVAAGWANPVLFAGFVTALALVLRRQVGAWMAGAFIVTLTALRGVEWDFSYGRPDHHGLHLMAFTGLLLGALLAGMGWVRVAGTESDSRRRARFWFTVSGVSGGLGLWIGSTQQCFCVGVLGAGAVLGALCFASKWTPEEESRFEPELWRHWSRVGAATSLAFYLLEYFPHHMVMRPEVNHPLLALGWLGAGEFMWVILSAKVDWPEVRARWQTMLGHAAGGLGGIAALPLAILWGPRRWFVLNDPFIARSARLISEGQPWLDFRNLAGVRPAVWDYTGLLMLAVPLAAGVLLGGRRQAPWRRSALLTLLLATVAFLAWTLVQSRWMGFLEVTLALLALLAVPCLPMIGGWRLAGSPLALLALLIPGWLGFGVMEMRTRSESPERHAHALLEGMMSSKETAWNLELYSRAGQPARVMTPPGPSPTLHYYGGVDTVGSYYWENLDAMHATLAFYNDTGDDAAARRIARERGLDFVVGVAQPAFVLEMQMLETGQVNVAAARRTLAFRISDPTGANLPAWLEPLPLLDAPMAVADGIRLYRVRRDRL